MKRLYFGGCILAASVIVSSAASADIYSDCIAAIEISDLEEVDRLAATITRFNDIPAAKRTEANACVTAALDEPVAYHSGTRSFLPLAEFEELLNRRRAAQDAKEAEEVAATEAVRQRICELQEVVTETRETIRQAEAAQQDRRIETLAVTIQECSAWFEDDARAALTNNVCNSIFASGGLPNSEIAGPTTSEVLLAELINLNATTELEILVKSGMLLETIEAMAAEMGAFEGGDPYECD